MKIWNQVLVGLFITIILIGAGWILKPSSIKAQANGVERDSWNLLLVNKNHKIPENYTVKLQSLADGQSVDERICSELQQMLDTARAQEVYPKIVSSYRTSEEQMKIMQEKISSYQEKGYSYDRAQAEARKWVAVPGTSEHELGLAVDINAEPTNSSNQKVHDWLAAFTLSLEEYLGITN